MRSVKRRGSGADSLIATMFGTSVRRDERRDADIHPIGGRIVVKHDGQPGRRRHRPKMIFELGGRRHVHHRRQHHEARAPMRSASRAKLTAAAVVNSETPAMTGTLPSLASTAASSTLRFSGALKELPSPTVPISTRPWTPSRAALFARRCVAAISTSRCRSNCVVAAGKTPDQLHERGVVMGCTAVEGCLRGSIDRIRCAA